MRATNEDVWLAREAVAELLKERLPVKTAYWLGKLSRKVGEHLRDIEAVRVRLIREYGTTDDNGNVTVSRDSERWPEFAAAFAELMAESVELEGLPDQKITLPSDTGVCITAAHLLALEPFVDVAG